MSARTADDSNPETDPRTQQEIDFRALFESAPGAYLVLKPDSPRFTILAVTDSYLRVTMTERKEIVGRGLFEVFPDNPNEVSPTGVQHLRSSLERVLKSKLQNAMPIQRYDVQRPGSSGREFEKRYWSPTNSPVLDHNAEIRYIIHRAEDVTEFVERKAGEAKVKLEADTLLARNVELELEVEGRSREIAEATTKLEQSNAELEAFNYTVSHDLRAPLRAMWGFANAMEEDYGAELNEIARGYLREITDSAKRMDQLINALLAYSRVGRGEITLVPVDTNKCFRDALHLISGDASHKDQASVDFQPNMPAVLGDSILLTAVLANLVSNAAKFVAQGQEAKVRVYCETGPEKIRIVVADEGIGIALENQGKIFGAFERLHGDDRYQGTGIGLAIVRRAIERMNGNFGVESSLGRGSRFWVELDRPGEISRAA